MAALSEFFKALTGGGKAAEEVATETASAGKLDPVYLAKNSLAVESATKFHQSQGMQVPAEPAFVIKGAMQGGWKPAPQNLNAQAMKDFYGQQELTWKPRQPEQPAAPLLPDAPPGWTGHPVKMTVSHAPVEPPKEEPSLEQQVQELLASVKKDKPPPAKTIGEMKPPQPSALDEWAKKTTEAGAPAPPLHVPPIATQAKDYNAAYAGLNDAKVRDYTPKELDWEYNVEYGKYTKPKFPNAFTSRDDFQQQYDAAPLRPLTTQEVKGLGNSMAASGIGKDAQWVHDTFGHRRDTKRILGELNTGTAPPIVLKDGDKLHLMAGQTRIAAGLAMGRPLAVKIIDVGQKPAESLMQQLQAKGFHQDFLTDDYGKLRFNNEQMQSILDKVTGKAPPGGSEADREARRITGRYLTQAFRGISNEPRRFESGHLYSSDSPALANLYTTYHGPEEGADRSIEKLFLNTDDYLVTDAKGKNWSNFNSYAIQKAKEQGKKGVVIKDVYDEPGGGGGIGKGGAKGSRLGKSATVYITFPEGGATRRSASAAFDESKFHLRDLLASGAAIMLPPALAGGLSVNKAEAQELDKAAAAKAQTGDYDYAGAKAAGIKPDARGHWPDTYKLPNHITFSDESKYHGVNGNAGGHWKHIEGPHWEFTPGPTNLQQHSIEELKAYFKKYEPDSKLILPPEPVDVLYHGQEYRIPGGMSDDEARKFIKDRIAKDPSLAPPPPPKPPPVDVLYHGQEYRIPGGMSDDESRQFIKDKLAEQAQAAQEEETYLQTVARKIAEGHEMAVEGEAALKGEAPLDSPSAIEKFAMRLAGVSAKDVTPEMRRHWQEVAGAAQLVGGVAQQFGAALSAGISKTVDAIPDSVWTALGVGEVDKPGAKALLKQIGDFASPMGGIGAVMKAPKFIKAARSFQLSPAAAERVRSVKALVDPANLSDEAKEATALIREKTGEAARATAISKAALKEDHKAGMIRNTFDNYEKRVNAMTPQDQLRLVHYMQTRSKGAVINDPELQAMADEFRNAMEQREQKLSQVPRLANAHMQDDYVSQYWEDPKAAKQFKDNWVAKQGSGANLKAKNYPTYADGIAAGLKPKTTNPIEIANRYMFSMDRFIAHNEIIEAGRAAGSVKFYAPGSKAANQAVANGWEKLDGILSEKHVPAGGVLKAYAPRDWALPYNNFVSKGINAYPNASKAYEALRATSNAMSQWELGFSGFHAVNMAWEATASRGALAASQLATGLGKATKGDVIGATKMLAGAARSTATLPAAFITSARKGHKLEQIYLGRVPGSKANREIVNLFTQAGGRFGRTASPDYTFTAAGSFFDAFKRGTLLKDIKGDFAGKTNMGKIGALGKQVGKIMQTVAQPLFDKYIPKLKMGAFAENMQAWIKANPAAGDAAKLAAGRKILDSIDNRMGELVQDNLMWNQWGKQAANLGLLAFSWTFGTIREVAGGALAGLKHPSRISMESAEYDPRIGYVVALPIVAFLFSNAYTYMKTGKPPKDFDDALDNTFAPKTGGTAPGVGGRGVVRERAALPGNIKDVLGWYNDARQELLNKRGPGVKTLSEIISGKDWQGKDIRLHDWSDAPGWIADYFRYVQQFQPIVAQQLEKGEKRGSAITPLESGFGIRPAPMAQQDPEGMARFKASQQRRALKARGKSDIRQQGQYAPNPPSGPIE
jgi:hypothetical protein